MLLKSTQYSLYIQSHCPTAYLTSINSRSLPTPHAFYLNILITLLQLTNYHPNIQKLTASPLSTHFHLSCLWYLIIIPATQKQRTTTATQTWWWTTIWLSPSSLLSLRSSWSCWSLLFFAGTGLASVRVWAGFEAAPALTLKFEKLDRNGF